MKKLLLVFSLFFAAFHSGAQVLFAPEAGFNLASYSVHVPGFLFTPDFVPVPGLRAGGVADVRINRQLSFQPGIYYVLTGLKYSLTIPLVGSASFATYIHNLQLPLDIVYKFGNGTGNRLFVSAGPFIGANLGGRAAVATPGISFLGAKVPATDTSYTVTVGNDSSDAIRRLDFGVGLSAGYQLRSGLFFRAQVRKGFYNMQPYHNNNINSIKSVNIGFTLGYFFHYKPEKKQIPVHVAPAAKKKK